MRVKIYACSQELWFFRIFFFYLKLESKESILIHSLKTLCSKWDLNHMVQYPNLIIPTSWPLFIGQEDIKVLFFGHKYFGHGTPTSMTFHVDSPFLYTLWSLHGHSIPTMIRYVDLVWLFFSIGYLHVSGFTTNIWILGNCHAMVNEQCESTTMVDFIFSNDPWQVLEMQDNCPRLMLIVYTTRFAIKNGRQNDTHCGVVRFDMCYEYRHHVNSNAQHNWEVL